MQNNMIETTKGESTRMGSEEDYDYSFEYEQNQDQDEYTPKVKKDSFKPSSVMQKLNDMIKKLAEVDQETKYNPEKFHWEVLKEWRDHNVKYQCLSDIQGYYFRAEDERGALRKQVLNCKKSYDKKITDNPNRRNPGTDLNILAHFESNLVTGEKFLRLTVRQWKSNIDPALTPMDMKRMNQIPHPDTIDHEIHSLKFFKFDEELKGFEFESEILYDISEHILDPKAGGFNNDFFITKNEFTYFFEKDRENHGFQLYRHSYGTQFPKFPTDINPYPQPSNEKMQGNFIRIPEDKALDDLQICFLKNACPNHSLRQEQATEEINFLDNQYIMLKDKPYIQGKGQDFGESPDLLIYKVSNGQCLYYSLEDRNLEYPFQDVQCGFLINGVKVD